MGIRIHKVLGYGLTDIKTKITKRRTFINDDRFNPLGWFLSDYEERDDIWSFDGFMYYWKNHRQETKYLDYDIVFNLFYQEQIKEGKALPDIYNCVVYDNEYGLKNLLLIIPPSSVNEWYRYDNIIDYHEEIETNSSLSNRYIHIPWGIFPWYGCFTNLQGQRYTKINSSLASEFIRTKINKRKGYTKQLEFYAKQLGFSSAKEAAKNIIPLIPEEVIVFCKYLNLFNDIDTIYQLRPMLYIYWS